MEEKDEIKTSKDKYVCIECKNENEIPERATGDVVECEYCGIEYEIVDQDENGNFTLRILEEEK